MPDIFIVTLDTLRLDHTGMYGYPLPVTPWLDKFSVRSFVVRHTVCPAVFTTPSHVSLFTGLYPFQHGVKTNHTPYTMTSPLLAEILSRHGYSTGAFISGYPLKARYSNLDRGFDTYDEDLNAEAAKKNICAIESHPDPSSHPNPSQLQTPYQTNIRDGMDTCRNAVHWLRNISDTKPVFIWVHLYDIHGPYSPPEPFNRFFYTENPCLNQPEKDDFDPAGIPPYQKFKGISDPNWYIAQYDGEIRYVDTCLAYLFAHIESLRKRERIVVITSDHGESLLEHGFYFDHGRDLYEPSLAVPLIFSTTQKKRKGLMNLSVSGTDIFPTLLFLLSMAPPREISGLNILSPANRHLITDRIVFSETKRCHTDEPSGQIFCAVQKGYKYIYRHDPKRSYLFHYIDEPSETMDLSLIFPRRAMLLRKHIEDAIRPGKPAGDSGFVMTERERDQMRNLGYIE